MDKFSTLSIREHLELDNIKELIDNIINKPNRVIINEILKLSKCMKDNIDNLDISKLQKKYYKNVIVNPEILEEEKEEEKEEKEEEKEDDTVFSFVNFPPKRVFNFEDPKLIKKDFPKYKILNTIRYNSYFRKVSGKILFY